jgi:hypothetical protein
LFITFFTALGRYLIDSHESMPCPGTTLVAHLVSLTDIPEGANCRNEQRLEGPSATIAQRRKRQQTIDPIPAAWLVDQSLWHDQD